MATMFQRLFSLFQPPTWHLPSFTNNADVTKLHMQLGRLHHGNRPWLPSWLNQSHKGWTGMNIQFKHGCAAYQLCFVVFSLTSIFATFLNALHPCARIWKMHIQLLWKNSRMKIKYISKPESAITSNSHICSTFRPSIVIQIVPLFFWSQICQLQRGVLYMGE